MTKIDKKTKYGGINITREAISSLVGEAVTSSYGIVGIVKKGYKEGDPILKKDSFKDGIIVFLDRKKNTYNIDVHVLVVYPCKITEVIVEAQKRVKYELEQSFSISFNSINIFVEGLVA